MKNVSESNEPSLVKYLNNVEKIDWDSNDVYQRCNIILDELSKSKVDLKKLIEWASKQEHLFHQFEYHAQFDRFVLIDSLEKQNFRLRLHI